MFFAAQILVAQNNRTKRERQLMREVHSSLFFAVLLMFPGCASEESVSTLQDTPPTISIANHYSPDMGNPTPADLTVKFGRDRGPDGFRANGPQYIVRAGTQTPPLNIDFNRHPDMLIQDGFGNIVPQGEGGYDVRERRGADGSVRNYSVDVGRDPNILRQLREEEPAQYDPNLIPTPAVPGYYPDEQPFYPPDDGGL